MIVSARTTGVQNYSDQEILRFFDRRLTMKLFCTGSANVIIDCQKQFQFLPVSYLIDIRTTKFLEKFTSSENLSCSLFAKQATENRQKYSQNMVIKSSPVSN